MSSVPETRAGARQRRAHERRAIAIGDASGMSAPPTSTQHTSDATLEDSTVEVVRVLSDRGPVRVVLARRMGKLVVIKRMTGFSPMLAQRLKRESEVVGKLDHPNIVPLLAVDGDSLVYAYCPGLTLAEALEPGPLPAMRSVKVACDLLAALSYAHELGVIHHDVKPDNVLIKGERAMLTDFGFAKDLALTAITSQETMLGTPSYMAPEEFGGTRTDVRSDLYAVGAVLYHMLVGEPPYGKQVLRFLVGDDRVPREPLPTSAARLSPVIDRALARDPSSRFASANEMRAALERAAQRAE